jgi:DNA-binding NtrC family response regulator
MSARGKVFLVDDDELIVSMLFRSLKNEGYEVRAETSALDIINKIKSWSPDAVLLDVSLPERNGIDILEELKTSGIDTQVVMLTADDTAETAVKAMKIGADDYLTKPFNIEEVKIVLGNIIKHGKLSKEVIDTDIIGESSAINEMKTKIERIAQAKVSTILVTGESGTGKELVARHIHHLIHDDASSGYSPFVAINCAALPENLLESELFGYEKGAFTDAKADKKGMFELAEGGTILLDEIGDMKQDLQSKLLRVLENRTVRRIGGKETPFDATVITTTNRNLEELVEKGEFRMDLFFRLNAFSLGILPLRERKEDIPILTGYYLSYFSSKYNKKIIKGFSSEAEKLLISYSWPGNVRELKNVIERIVVLESAEEIAPDHLPKEITQKPILGGPPPEGRFILPESGISLDDVQKDLIQQAFERANHNKSLTAKLLNISYDTLRYQLKKYGLE